MMFVIYSPRTVVIPSECLLGLAERYNKWNGRPLQHPVELHELVLQAVFDKVIDNFPGSDRVAAGDTFFTRSDLVRIRDEALKARRA